jgi:hypothetical protein
MQWPRHRATPPRDCVHHGMPCVLGVRADAAHQPCQTCRCMLHCTHAARSPCPYESPTRNHPCTHTHTHAHTMCALPGTHPLLPPAWVWLPWCSQPQLRLLALQRHTRQQAHSRGNCISRGGREGIGMRHLQALHIAFMCASSRIRPPALTPQAAARRQPGLLLQLHAPALLQGPHGHHQRPHACCRLHCRVPAAAGALHSRLEERHCCCVTVAASSRRGPMLRSVQLIEWVVGVSFGHSAAGFAAKRHRDLSHCCHGVTHAVKLLACMSTRVLKEGCVRVDVHHAKAVTSALRAIA